MLCLLFPLLQYVQQRRQSSDIAALNYLGRDWLPSRDDLVRGSGSLAHLQPSSTLALTSADLHSPLSTLTSLHLASTALPYRIFHHLGVATTMLSSGLRRFAASTTGNASARNFTSTAPVKRIITPSGSLRAKEVSPMIGNKYPIIDHEYDAVVVGAGGSGRLSA